LQIDIFDLRQRAPVLSFKLQALRAEIQEKTDVAICGREIIYELDLIGL
jgi:hypothetical protein